MPIASMRPIRSLVIRASAGPASPSLIATLCGPARLAPSTARRARSRRPRQAFGGPTPGWLRRDLRFRPGPGEIVGAAGLGGGPLALDQHLIVRTKARRQPSTGPRTDGCGWGDRT